MNPDSAARVSLSGYLPGGDRNGLSRMAEHLVRAFHDAYDAGDSSGEHTRLVVLGITDCISVKLPADPDSSSVVEVRFVTVEALTGQVGETARLLLDQARRERLGDGAEGLPGIDSAIVEAATHATPISSGTGARRARPKRGGPAASTRSESATHEPKR